jgi:ABC-2 type transport system permease protein
MLILKQFWAFIKRDFLIETSYKLAFFTDTLWVFFQIVIFYFISELIGLNASSHLQAYGGEYFPFVLIGIAFSVYQTVGLGAFIKSIREEEMMGTLEAILSSPTRLSVIIISSSLWKFIFASIRVLIFIILGFLLFGLDLSNANFISGLVIIILMIVSFSSIGILSANFIIVIKKGEFINTFINSISALLGGVYFPITMLPGWLGIFSYILPITYSLRTMRYAMFQDYSLMKLLPEITALVVFTLTMMPLSILAFKYAVKRAKVDGSLGHY